MQKLGTIAHHDFLLLQRKISAILVTIRDAEWDYMTKVRMAVLCVGIVWCSTVSVKFVMAQHQSWDGVQIDELKRLRAEDNTKIQINDQRIKNLERRLNTADQEKINDRVIRLETIAETNRELLIGIMIGLLSLLAEAMHRFFSTMKPRQAG